MKRLAKPGAMLLLFFLALAGLTLHNTAWADSGGYENYGLVGVGGNQFGADLDDAGYNAGITSNATYGRYFGNNLVFEGTVGYLYTDQDFSGSTGVAGSYTRDDKISVSSILATLKGEIPIGPVTFSAGYRF